MRMTPDGQARMALDKLGRRRNVVLNVDAGRRVALPVFLLHGVEDGDDDLAGGVVLIGRNEDFRRGLERDGVAERTPDEGNHLYVVVFQQRKQDTGSHFVGIGPVQADVHAGMAALQAAHLEAKGFHARGRIIFIVIETGRYVQAAGAPHAQLPFLFRVQVQENIAVEDAGLEGVGARHAGFLVIGYQDLQRAMLHGRVFQGGQGQRYANAVVRAQRGAVRRYPFAVYIGADGICEEIVRTVGGFLRHHVHVALQDNALAVFHAGRGRNTDDDIAGIVLDGLKAMGLAPVVQVVDDLALVLGRARDLSKCVEILPHYLGF